MFKIKRLRDKDWPNYDWPNYTKHSNPQSELTKNKEKLRWARISGNSDWMIDLYRYPQIGITPYYWSIVCAFNFPPQQVIIPCNTFGVSAVAGGTIGFAVSGFNSSWFKSLSGYIGYPGTGINGPICSNAFNMEADKFANLTFPNLKAVTEWVFQELL
jgi:hypothetical protein